MRAAGVVNVVDGEAVVIWFCDATDLVTGAAVVALPVAGTGLGTEGGITGTGTCV